MAFLISETGNGKKGMDIYNIIKLVGVLMLLGGAVLIAKNALAPAPVQGV